MSDISLDQEWKAITLIWVESSLLFHHSLNISLHFFCLDCFREPLMYGVSNIVLGVCKNLRLIMSWCMEIDTMAASIAFDVCSLHGSLRTKWMLKLSHGCILPWVFTSIQEVDVVSLDIKSTEELIDFSDCWILHEITEDSMAVVVPIIHIQSYRSHWEEAVRDLEPSEL